MGTRRDWRRLYEEGLKAIQARNFSQAIGLFTQAIDNGADRWEPFYARAWAVLQHDGKDPKGMKAAEADLREALKRGGPYSADAAALLGQLYRQRGNHEEAVQCFLQAFGRTSQTDLVEEGLVWSLSEMLDHIERSEVSAEGLQYCRNLEERIRTAALPRTLRDGLLAEILATQAYCHEQLNEDEQARHTLRRLGQLVPGHPRVPEGLAGAESAQPATRTTDTEPTFADIGGRDVGGTFQEKLCRLFDAQFGNPDLEATRQLLKEYGQSPTRAILLFGPSGCGKTYMVRAFAGEYRCRHGRELPVHRLRLNEILDRYVGEGEKAVSRIFDEAIRTQPSLVFVDEVDAIGGSRDFGQDWRAMQTGHFLQELDRLKTREAFVLLIGCTNRIWAVDLALLRRFGEMIPVELPDERVRREVFRVHLRKLGARVFPENLDLDALAKQSHGMTPGDIENVIRRAVDELRMTSESPDEPRRLENQNLLEALRKHKPIHVRKWVQQSLQSLRQAGYTEMADEVERVYGPYVPDAGAVETESPAWSPLPEEGWREEQEYDLAFIRGLRRASR